MLEDFISQSVRISKFPFSFSSAFSSLTMLQSHPNCLDSGTWRPALLLRGHGNFHIQQRQPPHWRQRFFRRTPKHLSLRRGWAKSLGVSSRSIDNRHFSCRIGDTKTSMMYKDIGSTRRSIGVAACYVYGYCTAGDGICRWTAGVNTSPSLTRDFELFFCSLRRAERLPTTVADNVSLSSGEILPRHPHRPPASGLARAGLGARQRCQASDVACRAACKRANITPDTSC
ncbi:hypothetical protein QBC39DRAFT_111168 [Podospora conica]|nr:hypothetical protein QBC39DRAFT_111168 [Schizothecium conicum]